MRRHQGGPTLRHLAKRGGFKLRALTRKPDGDAAKAVAAVGAEVVAGDLDDAASLERALAGAWGIYSVQNTWEAGLEIEKEQGRPRRSRLCGPSRFRPRRPVTSRAALRVALMAHI